MTSIPTSSRLAARLACASLMLATSLHATPAMAQTPNGADAAASRVASEAGAQQPSGRFQSLGIEVAGAALAHRFSPPDDYCDAFPDCDAGGATPGGMMAVRIANGRLALSFELSASGETVSSRSHPLYDEVVAFRATRVNVLAGYRFRPRGRMSYTLLGGMSETVGDAAGAFRFKQVLFPGDGHYAIDERKWALGGTGGGDAVLDLGHRLRLVVPVRVTWTAEGRLPESWPHPLEIQVGAGLAFRLYAR